jgi:transposase
MRLRLCAQTLWRRHQREARLHSWVFTVERHIRGKWACARCQSLVQAPVPARVIDKGLPTAGLLAQELVPKCADHLPPHRQESIFARAGMALSRSTLAEWVGTCGVQLQPLVNALKHEVLGHRVLHADETPCSRRARRRPTRLTCGPTARASSKA